MKLQQLLLFCLLQVVTTSGFAQKITPPKLHKEAADFTLPTPAGESLRLSSLRGQVVLVDFWASWCMPCRAEIPHLKELYAQYHAAGLEIVSVSADAHPEAWKRAMGQEQMPWKQVLDTYSGTGNFSDVAGGYGVESIPFTLLLDKEGRAIAINPEPRALDKQLKKLFGN
ncbi:MAG TPA: TlpA disulfide reductase family protein [Puia sp.]|jgi:thiol-disulfide isomerase/thioredoxin|nr:TlpA disulfide reductase family protein [Puia sp.]